MNTEVEHLRKNKITNNNDELTAGFLSINSDHTIVAYASLGETDVSIARGNDGKVRIEIDDTADEDVYVSINAQPVTVIDDNDTLEKPWHPPAPTLSSVKDLLNLALGPIITRADRPKMQYRLSMSRKSTGMTGEYATITDVLERIQRYEKSFPGEIIEVNVVKI